MKITHPNLASSAAGAPSPSGVAAQRRATNTPAERPNASAADAVELSHRSGRLQRAVAELATSAAAEPDRLQTIRAQLASGDYRVDTARTARGLLDLESQLLPTQRSS